MMTSKKMKNSPHKSEKTAWPQFLLNDILKKKRSPCCCCAVLWLKPKHEAPESSSEFSCNQNRDELAEAQKSSRYSLDDDNFGLGEDMKVTLAFKKSAEFM